MNYRVVIQPEAEDDMAKILLWIAKDSRQNALNWLRDMFEQIETLNRFPLRCPLAPESRQFKDRIRHLIVGNVRVIFMIRGKTIRVLRIRHAARLPLRRLDRL